jgi:hypothetical protein
MSEPEDKKALVGELVNLAVAAAGAAGAAVAVGDPAAGAAIASGAAVMQMHGVFARLFGRNPVAEERARMSAQLEEMTSRLAEILPQIEELDRRARAAADRAATAEARADRAQAGADQAAEDAAGAASSGMKAEEILELILQTVRNMQSSADREKRDRMTLVLVSSLRDLEATPAERRFLVRVAAQLEREHVDFLWSPLSPWGASSPWGRAFRSSADNLRSAAGRTAVPRPRGGAARARARRLPVEPIVAVGRIVAMGKGLPIFRG